MRVEGGKLSHAYLVACGTEEERMGIAARLAQTMVCAEAEGAPCGVCRHCRKALAGIHPDIITVERDRDDKGEYKREFQVEKAREMLKDAWIRPNEAEKKVYIVRDAQTMNRNAQNAMLKLLEEPPGGACFILCADNAAALLPTVRSRCVEISGQQDPETAPDPATAQRVESYLHLAAQRDLSGLVELLGKWEKLSTEEIRGLFAALRHRLTEAACMRRPLPMPRQRVMHLLELANRGEQYLRVNVGSKHLLGLLAARTMESE